MQNAPEDTFLFILKNGPIHAVEDYVGCQLEFLSKRFRGELWVTGSFAADTQIGRFRLRVVKQEQRGPLAYLQYRNAVLRRVAEIDGSAPKRLAVITYDPFRNGLIARSIKKAFGWPLIVEINGAYGNPDNFADAEGSFARKLKPLLMRAVAKSVVNHADGLRLLYREQLADFLVPPQRIVIRQYFDAVPLERFDPRPEEPYLLHLGYPFHRKGVDLLLAAFERLRPEFPGWQLVLIGHELGSHIPVVPSGVRVLPGISNSEAAHWISRCAILVLASRSEAMGRVLIEAASAGKPRIAARVDGTYTVVSHELDGLLFEKGSVDDLTAAMRRLMKDEVLRAKYGAAARSRALVDFSSERYVAAVADLVDAVLAERQSHR